MTYNVFGGTLNLAQSIRWRELTALPESLMPINFVTLKSKGQGRAAKFAYQV